MFKIFSRFFGTLPQNQRKVSLMKLFFDKKAQSFMEYAILIMVITTALVAMYPYIRRSINARLKQIQVELNESKR